MSRSFHQSVKRDTCLCLFSHPQWDALREAEEGEDEEGAEEEERWGQEALF